MNTVFDKMKEKMNKTIKENEKEGIKYYNQGQALFICGNRRMNIQVILTQEELDSFGSGGGH